MVYKVSDEHHPHGPKKALSQSAVDGINARGGFAAPSPSGTYPLSPFISQERNTTIKFEPNRSMDFSPSSPAAQISDPLKARRSVGSIQEVVSESSQKDAKGSWISRVFSRKSKDETNDDEKKYP